MREDGMTEARLMAFVDRCKELRNGSPNAFYMHVDAFCKEAALTAGEAPAPRPIAEREQ